MRVVGWGFALAFLVSACTFVRSLDYLSNGAAEPDASSPVPDGSSTVTPPTPEASVPPLVNAMPADVTPNAVVLTTDLYVAGSHAGKGWVGHFDPTGATLLGQTDVDSTTALLAIGAGTTGLVIAGSNGANAVVGVIGNDLGMPAVQPLTTTEVGTAVLNQVGVANGVTWSAGTVTLTADNSVVGIFAVGDTECPAPVSTATTAPVLRISLAYVSDATIALTSHTDAHVTYARYAGTDCTRSAFPTGADGGNELTIITAPTVYTAVGNGSYFYGAGTYQSDTSTFFVQYDHETGKRPGTNGYSELANQPSSFVASAHDGLQLFALGTFVGVESLLAEGQSGITPSTLPMTLPLVGYGARGIAVEPYPSTHFYLTGGATTPYLLRCDKTAGCPAHP